MLVFVQMVLLCLRECSPRTNPAFTCTRRLCFSFRAYENCQISSSQVSVKIHRYYIVFTLAISPYLSNLRCYSSNLNENRFAFYIFYVFRFDIMRVMRAIWLPLPHRNIYRMLHIPLTLSSLLSFVCDL